MRRRKFGASGLECSEIGLGTWALGSSVYGQVESQEAERLIRGAIDEGIDFFDTAPLYGTKTQDGVAESALGKALGDRRNDVVVATKFGRTSTDVMPGRFTAKEARASCEASLRRLGRDYLDLLFFHSPFTPEEIADDVWAELDRLRQEGKVRAIGHSVSMYADTKDLSAEWMRERRISAIQVVLSPFNRETRPLIEVARAEGCGVVARECMANGFLSGAIRKDTVFPEGSLNARYDRAEIAERVDYAEALRALMVGGEIENLPQATYRWVLDQAGVSVALSGAKRWSELTDCLKASRAAPFAAGALRAVEAAHRRDFAPA